MDGNGRWAKARGLPRSLGHMEGTSRVKEIIREADRLGVKILTLYCFSTENWKRPEDEVSILMKLLKEYLLKERQELHDNNVKLRALGQIDRLPEHLQKLVRETEAFLSNNTGMILNFCISYGGRSEILRATREIAKKIAAGELQAEELSEEIFSNELYTAGLPDPDLIIRTSGEARISNFLLWQIAYSELYLTETSWPEFRPQHLKEACEAFSTRKRRFGSSDEASLTPTPSTGKVTQETR
jgi:undecaprenyl diphosphate synthase